MMHDDDYDDYEDDDDSYNPVEPFSQDEFAVHDDDELEELDAGGDPDVLVTEQCPNCGTVIVFDEDDEKVECQNCGCEFDVN